MDLTNLNLKNIVANRNILIAKLNSQRENLVAANVNQTNDHQIERIERRISRLTIIEDVLRKSLDIFTEIVSSPFDSATLDQLMEKERTMIINEFQQVILKIKNEQNALTESKISDIKQEEEKKILQSNATQPTLIDGLIIVKYRSFKGC
jgi:hypothetical protein